MTVVQAIPKGNRGELAVELLTEIGVARIVPWAASRSVAVWKGERAAKSVERWRSDRAGGLQAGAATVVRRGRRPSRRLPTSRPSSPPPTSPWCCTRTRPRRWPALRVPAAGSVVVVVGPEGGLSDDEVASVRGRRRARRTSRGRGAAHLDRRRRRRGRAAVADLALGWVSNRPVRGLADRYTGQEVPTAVGYSRPRTVLRPGGYAARRTTRWARSSIEVPNMAQVCSYSRAKRAMATRRRSPQKSAHTRRDMPRR